MSQYNALCEAGARVVERIRTEHVLLARIIAAMQAWVVGSREPGARPDPELFRAMLRYVEEVPDKVHHPLEDEILFPALAHIPGARAVIEELEREHAAGVRMLQALRAAHEALERGAANALNGLATAVDEFAEFYWAHMRKEEQALLPLAAGALEPGPWSAIEASFRAVNDPLFGSEVAEEYRNLHRFITSRLSGPMKGFVQDAVVPQNR